MAEFYERFVACLDWWPVKMESPVQRIDANQVTDIQFRSAGGVSIIVGSKRSYAFDGVDGGISEEAKHALVLIFTLSKQRFKVHGEPHPHVDVVLWLKAAG